jgi:putative DNA primase/helicase
MVILSANEAPESSDRTSGQERRKLTVGLDNRIPEYEGRNLAEEFKQYLPGLLKRVLEIPRQRVTDLIKHTEKNVPALAQKKWAQMIETNPIAGWLDECLILSPQAKSYIGKDDIDKSGEWLYANFCKYQRESGHRGVLPVKRFSSNLRDLLKNQMKVSVVEGRDRNGAYIQGIGLRCFYDPNGTDFERPITKGSCDNNPENCDGFEEKCDGFVTDESLTSAGCDGCDGFLENREILEKSNEFSVIERKQIVGDCAGEIAKNQVADECVGESGKNPSHPSHPSLPMVSASTNLSQQEENPSQQEQVKQIKVQTELPLYQRADGQIEVDRLVKSDEDEWMAQETIEEIAHSLSECEDAETLALLRECWIPKAMNAACKLLSPEKHAQIKQWVIELNSIT